MIELSPQSSNGRAVHQWLQPWTFSRREPDTLAERMRYDQDIREQNRGIETEPSYRLQCHFRGKLRRKAQRKKITGPLTNCTILGQVPSSLPHHPQRRRTTSTTIENIEQSVHYAAPAALASKY